MADVPLLETRTEGPFRVLRMRREGQRNAINRELALAIEAALDDVESDSRVRAAVLAGGPAVFSAGSDVKDPQDKRTPRGGEYGLIRRRRSKPLIAAVEGAALGGGFEIVLSCDLVVAAEGATFALPEGRLGLVATSGALFRAARALPRAVAHELLLTGAPLTAERAYAFGLVNRIARPGHAEAGALELAREVCRSAPTSVRLTLEALQAMDEPDDERGWRVTEQARDQLAFSDDPREGLAAFRERRAPRWSG